MIVLVDWIYLESIGAGGSFFFDTDLISLIFDCSRNDIYEIVRGHFAIFVSSLYPISLDIARLTDSGQ